MAVPEDSDGRPRVSGARSTDFVALFAQEADDRLSRLGEQLLELERAERGPTWSPRSFARPIP